MNILLIYPGLVDGFGSYRSGSDWFNHGIGMISAILKRAGHRVSCQFGMPTETEAKMHQTLCLLRNALYRWRHDL